MSFLINAFDLVLTLPTWVAARLLRTLRRKGLSRFSRCTSILNAAGVYPLIDHYYDPYVDVQQLRKHPDENRALPGIDWNEKWQLNELGSLTFADELSDVPFDRRTRDIQEFHFNNGMFGPGSADIYYQLIRKHKPKRLVEIGCGMSTLIAQKAIAANHQEDSAIQCAHICIEPYEQPWLESLPITLIRQRVEDVGLEIFDELEGRDFLFIDSSHTIRPGGDVLFEYQELLPRLNDGVFVHIHDIFSPQDYPLSWFREGRIWQEQYLVEAFLCCNDSFRIVLALNWLYQNHHDALQAVCPSLGVQTKSARGPSSLWLQRT